MGRTSLLNVAGAPSGAAQTESASKIPTADMRNIPLPPRLFMTNRLREEYSEQVGGAQPHHDSTPESEVRISIRTGGNPMQTKLFRARNSSGVNAAVVNPNS